MNRTFSQVEKNFLYLVSILRILQAINTQSYNMIYFLIILLMQKIPYFRLVYKRIIELNSGIYDTLIDATIKNSLVGSIDVK